MGVQAQDPVGLLAVVLGMVHVADPAQHLESQVPYLLCAATQALTALLLWCVHPVLMCQFVWALAQSSVEAVVCVAELIRAVSALSRHRSGVFPFST